MEPSHRVLDCCRPRGILRRARAGTAMWRLVAILRGAWNAFDGSEVGDRRDQAVVPAAPRADTRVLRAGHAAGGAHSWRCIAPGVLGWRRTRQSTAESA